VPHQLDSTSVTFPIHSDTRLTVRSLRLTAEGTTTYSVQPSCSLEIPSSIAPKVAATGPRSPSTLLLLKSDARSQQIVSSVCETYLSLR
jgi:hypothetical protein